MVDAFYAVWILDAGNFYGKRPKYNKKMRTFFRFALFWCCVSALNIRFVVLFIWFWAHGTPVATSMSQWCWLNVNSIISASCLFTCVCVCVSLCPNFMIYQSLVDYGRVFFSTFARHLSHHISMFRWRQSIILAAAIILHHIIPQHANERRKKHIN